MDPNGGPRVGFATKNNIEECCWRISIHRSITVTSFQLFPSYSDWKQSFFLCGKLPITRSNYISLIKDMQFEFNLMIKMVAQNAKPVNLSSWNAEMSQLCWEIFTKVLLLYTVTIWGIFSFTLYKNMYSCTQNVIFLLNFKIGSVVILLSTFIYWVLVIMHGQPFGPLRQPHADFGACIRSAGQGSHRPYLSKILL